MTGNSVVWYIVKGAINRKSGENKIQVLIRYINSQSTSLLYLVIVFQIFCFLVPEST